ncbi:MAG: monoacylglycerol lipase [Phototrophicaceae bacterium]
MTTDSFIASDGTKIHTVYWRPAGISERVVIIAHGKDEHSGRYEHVAKHLTDAGYHVYALDHRGHGQSGGDRSHVDDDTQFITDLKQYHTQIKDTHPNATIFLLGHSMGSVISLQFILTYPDAVDAIIVTGTATDVSTGVSSLLRTAGNFVHNIYPQAPIQPPGGDEVLTRAPEMLEKAGSDPLFYKGWTKSSLAKYILDTGEMIQERASEITMPILIMHGEDDALTPISGSHFMYEHVSSSDKTLKTWANMLHEILNEVEREAVLKTITDWLAKH